MRSLIDCSVIYRNVGLEYSQKSCWASEVCTGIHSIAFNPNGDAFADPMALLLVSHDHQVRDIQ